MTYEALYDESATDEEFIAAYQEAINSGDAWRLEGAIGRTAMSLLESGALILGPRPVRDYWGSLVPAWWMVEPGSKGSPEYADQERPQEPSEAEKVELLEAVGVEVV